MNTNRITLTLDQLVTLTKRQAIDLANEELRGAVRIEVPDLDRDALEVEILQINRPLVLPLLRSQSDFSLAAVHLLDLEFSPSKLIEKIRIDRPWTQMDNNLASSQGWDFSSVKGFTFAPEDVSDWPGFEASRTPAEILKSIFRSASQGSNFHRRALRAFGRRVNLDQILQTKDAGQNSSSAIIRLNSMVSFTDLPLAFGWHEADGIPGFFTLSGSDGSPLTAVLANALVDAIGLFGISAELLNANDRDDAIRIEFHPPLTLQPEAPPVGRKEDPHVGP